MINYLMRRVLHVTVCYLDEQYSVLPTVHAVTTSFAVKLVLFLWQIDVKVYLINFSRK